MQELKLFGMSKLYQADKPVRQHPGAHTLMGMLTVAETQYSLATNPTLSALIQTALQHLARTGKNQCSPGYYQRTVTPVL